VRLDVVAQLRQPAEDVLVEDAGALRVVGGQVVAVGQRGQHHRHPRRVPVAAEGEVAGGGDVLQERAASDGVVGGDQGVDRHEPVLVEVVVRHRLGLLGHEVGPRQQAERHLGGQVVLDPGRRWVPRPVGHGQQGPRCRRPVEDHARPPVEKVVGNELHPTVLSPAG
jgi:hypothetical protein